MDAIEQMLDIMEEYVLGCKTQAFSSTKIICDRETMLSNIRELRAKMPEELSRVQKMLANQNAIIENARKRAEIIVEDAKKEAERLVKQDNIVKEAIAKSNSIMQNTTERANGMLHDAIGEATNIRIGAINYTDKIIAELESFISDAYEREQKYSSKLLDTYREQLDTLQNNRSDLSKQMDLIHKGGMNSLESERVEGDKLESLSSDEIADIPDLN